MELVLNDDFLELSSVETELIDGGNIDWREVGDIASQGGGAYIGECIGGAVGGAVGGPAGVPVGKVVGGIAGAAVGHVLYNALD